MTKRKQTGPLFFKPQRNSMKKTPRVAVQTTIDKLSAEGRGMAFHNGKPLFIANALPGESVRARIMLEKREYAEAELLDIVAPAPERISARCKLFGRCGGCALQMLDYTAQLQHKSATLEYLLRAHIAKLDAPIVAEPWHYRHRARFSVSEENGRPVVGFKAANSHRVIDISVCAILDARLQALLPQLPSWLATLEHWRRLEEIRIAVDSSGKIALSWHAKRALPSSDIDTLNRLCGAANIICSGAAALLYSVPSQDTAFEFGLDDFTQVNPAVNDRLVARALDWLQLTGAERVADFFCGLGNFSLPLAKCAAHVRGYEIETAMVERAAANAGGLGNIEFSAADLYAADAVVDDNYEIALLDPPRAGAKILCTRLAASKKLRRIVYVSCNPQTLIRDIDLLAAGGFAVVRAALVDMFPQTGHIETIVQLARSC